MMDENNTLQGGMMRQFHRFVPLSSCFSWLRGFISHSSLTPISLTPISGLGHTDTHITPHPVYLDIDRDETGKQAAYRALFRSQLDEAALANIRLAL